MPERRLLVVFVVFLLNLTFTSAHEANADRPPNILFVLTDDQGWSSLGCYGNSLVQTPQLDRLAAAGMRFTDAYVMPQCTPTRAALLTGQHTARNQMWHVIGWYGSPWARVAEPMFREQLEPAACRLPRALQQAGYVTGMAGKWHLTNSEHGHYVYLKKSSAQKYGFDWVAGAGPGSHNEGDKWVRHLTDAACGFIEENRDRPWFFYLAHHTLHPKVSAPGDLVQKYLELGAPAEGMHNATYLAAIEHMDGSIGRLLAKLREHDLERDTLVVFLTDNGGIDTTYMLPEWSGDPLDGSVPLKVKEQAFDNAPLRAGKGSLYEGGIRVPCIAHWPGVIESGVVCKTPIHVTDWYPTLLSVAGAKPEEPTDGVDLDPLFRGGSIAERSLYWYAPLYDLRWASTPAAVIRQGKWKLIEHFGDRFDRAMQYQAGRKSELFDLSSDLSESSDVADQHPQKVKQLRGELVSWIRSIPAEVPESNPHYAPGKAFLETKQKQPWNR